MSNDKLKLVLRQGVWYMSGTFKGERIRKSTGYEERRKLDAELYLAKFISAANAGEKLPATDMRLYEVCEKYMVQAKTADKERYRVNRIMQFFGDIPVRLINRKSAESLVKFFKDKIGIAENTIDREMRVFGAIMNYAHYEGWADKIVIKRPRTQDDRERYLEKPERDRYLKLVQPKFLPVFMLLFYTGARLSEVLNLKYDDIKPTKVTYTSRKGRHKVVKTRVVPLRKEIAPLIVEAKDRLRWAAPGVERYNYQNVRLFKFDKKGIWNEHRRICNELKIRDFRIHDIRHTFASLLAMEGASELMLMELLGHSSVNMVARYVKLNTKSKSKVLELL